jgi:hypothetical protein
MALKIAIQPGYDLQVIPLCLRESSDGRLMNWQKEVNVSFHDIRPLIAPFAPPTLVQQHGR